MKTSFDYFNSHSNHGRADNMRIYGVCSAPAITRKDEKAYSLAMEKNKDRKRKPSKITLPALPF